MRLATWLRSASEEPGSFRGFQFVMGSDDFADAYHGFPDHPGQLPFCVMTFRNIDANTMCVRRYLRVPFRLSGGGKQIESLP